MTNVAINLLTNDELVQEFRDLARQTGTVYTSDLTQEKYRPTPERQQRVARLQAIAGELRARAPLEQIKGLFEDDDVDIRGWAAARFLETLPALADATLTGLIVGKSASEVLEKLRHVRTPPRARPTLQEMSVDELIQRFEDAATREYWTRFAGEGDVPEDAELCERIVDELHEVMRELKHRDALARLLPYLASDNITVRAEAARATLTIDPTQAARVLETVIASGDLDEIGAASLDLERFRQGKIVVWGVG